MAGKAKKKDLFPEDAARPSLAARAGGILRDDALDGAASKSLEGMREQADKQIRAAIKAMEAIVFAQAAGEALDDQQMLRDPAPCRPDRHAGGHAAAMRRSTPPPRACATSPTA